jgi:hypothetical protein
LGDLRLWLRGGAANDLDRDVLRQAFLHDLLNHRPLPRRLGDLLGHAQRRLVVDLALGHALLLARRDAVLHLLGQP